MNRQAPLRFSDQEDPPFYFSLLFSPLVIGSLTGSGLDAPKLTLFSLTLFSCVLAYHLGGKLKLDQARKSKNQLVKHPFLAPVLFLGVSGLCLWFFSMSTSPYATALLCLACFCMTMIRILSVISGRSLLAKCLAVICFSSVLAILGVYSQSNDIRLKTFVLGFGTGSMLAAAAVAKAATVLDSLGWRRKLQARPGLAPQLYALLLMAIPSLCIALASLGVFPFPILLALLAQLASPRLAASFLDQTTSDERIYQKTLTIALVSSALMLLGGLLSRG